MRDSRRRAFLDPARNGFATGVGSRCGGSLRRRRYIAGVERRPGAFGVGYSNNFCVEEGLQVFEQCLEVSNESIKAARFCRELEADLPSVPWVVPRVRNQVQPLDILLPWRETS